jgi:hypothetical protein
MFESYLMKVGVLKALGIEVAAFRRMALCNVVDRYQRFGVTYCRMVFYPEDGDCRFYRNFTTRLNRVTCEIGMRRLYLTEAKKYFAVRLAFRNMRYPIQIGVHVSVLCFSTIEGA